MPKKTSVIKGETKSTPLKAKETTVNSETKQTPESPAVKNKQEIVAPSPEKELEKHTLPIQINLRDIATVIATPYNHANKYPLFIDPTERIQTFFRHRDCNMINCMDSNQMKSEYIRIALISAIRFGKPFIIGMYIFINRKTKLKYILMK